MRITKGTIYELNIPFNEIFTHSTKARTASDAIVVKLVAEDGNIGYGEGLPRPYVTGETVEFALTHVQDVLWPRIKASTYETVGCLADLEQFDTSLGAPVAEGVLAPNAARATVEIALIDCALRAEGRGLGEYFIPNRDQVEYAGVIPANNPEKAASHAKKMAMLGLAHLKIKIAMGDDLARIQSVVDVVGENTPIRLDANAAWSLDEALGHIAQLEQFNVEAIEAPIARTTVDDLKKYKNATKMPISVDEYLVTTTDAEELIAKEACDIFNLRVSKLGGLWRTWQLAQKALSAGLKLQFGAQVGETAILSAAGRHLIAALPDVLFAEGSAGTLLLEKDVSEESVAFGFQGLAPLLTGPGLGISVKEDVLEQYAKRKIELL